MASFGSPDCLVVLLGGGEQEDGVVHRDREDHREEEHRRPGVEEALGLEAEQAGAAALLEDQPGDAERGGGGQQAGQGAEQRRSAAPAGRPAAAGSPSARTTPMTSGVESSSWVLRSRFSTAAPPTSADVRQVGAQPVDGVGERGVGRVDGRDGLDERQAAAVGRGLRGHGAGDARVVGRAPGGGRLGVGPVDDDLERAGGAVAEGVLDQVVADPGAGVLGQHLDRRHRGLQAQDRCGEGEQHDERRPGRRPPGASRAARPRRRTSASGARRCAPRAARAC